MNQKKQQNITAILHGISIVAILFIIGLFLYCLGTLGKLAQMKQSSSATDSDQSVTQEATPDESSTIEETPPTADDAATVEAEDMKAQDASSESEQKANDLESVTEEDTSSTEPELSPYLADDYIIYREGFLYSSLSELLKDRITGFSYHENDYITYDDLRYLNVLYYDFNGEVQSGELICNKAIAEDLLDIFSQLFDARYSLEKIRLVDEYGADDDLSCADNNTSCFNFRVVANSKNLSKHAYGLAIDVNPFYNPYVTYPDGVEHISPEGSEPYADRTNENEHLIHKGDMIYQLFIDHGFTWGGNWKSLKDYQHFQKEI